jgi:DNA replication protein DnaC
MKRARLEEEFQKIIPQMAEAPADPIAMECGCGGVGMVAVEEGGHRYMKDCICLIRRRVDGHLRRAQVPERYREKTLDSYDAMGGHPSLARGLATARRYVAEYPVGTRGRGVLMVGTVGVGKTHLAVGILRELVMHKGARGRFCDFRDLLNQIKRTFSDKSVTEAEILDPVFAADVLVLDELGAVQATDWTFDAVERIINGRYNDNKSTIITTNLPNLPPGGNQLDGAALDYGRAVAAARGETLGDRIGARMHSRLQEMCLVVEMSGEDYRAKKGRR